MSSYREFSKIEAMRGKCPSDEWLWYAKDINGGNGCKSYFAVRRTDWVKFDYLFETNSGIYEVLPPETEIRPYFDCEINGIGDSDKQAQLITQFTDWLTLVFKRDFCITPDYAILNSSNGEKLSYHVIIRNVKVESVQELKPFIAFLWKELDTSTLTELQWVYGERERRCICDQVPYGANQCFRAINQGKLGGSRVLVGNVAIEETLVRPSFLDGTVLNLSKYRTRPKKVSVITPTNTEIIGLTDIQTAYKEEFMDYYKFNLFNNIANEGWDKWRNMAFALHSTFGPLGLDMFLTFSRINTSLHNETDSITFYEKIKTTTTKRITFQSIRQWASMSDKKTAKRIYGVYIDKTEQREFCENDNDVVQYLMTELRDDLIYTGRVYFKVNHLWICDSELIRSALITFIMNSPVYRPAEKDPVAQWKNYSAADKVYKALLCQVSNERFDQSKFHTTTKHRFCFLNGVLDFSAKRFYDWDEVDFEYYPVIQIPMDYVEGTAQHQADIKQKVLEPLFGETLPLALKFLSRALAGCIEDKNFGTYVGNRNCGKGVLYELLRSFGDYVGSFDVKNMMCERDARGGGTSRDNFWLLEFEFMRLAVSQEVPDDFLGMRMKTDSFKRICSGGDTQIARRCFDKRDTHFQIDTTPFMMGNGAFPITGDLREHHVSFESAIQFKDQAYIDQVREEQGDDAVCKYRIADSNIKTLCSSDDWKLAFISLMLESYEDTIITVDFEIETANPLMNQFNADWVITKDPLDMCLCSDFSQLGPKLAPELLLLGVKKIKCNSRGEFRKKVVFVGVKLRVEEEDLGDI